MHCKKSNISYQICLKRFEWEDMSYNGFFGWLSFSLFLVALCSGTTMKILTNHPKLFKNPDTSNNKNNLFGASIGLSHHSNSIYVGAPKHSYGGGIYRCNIPSDLDGNPNCAILNALFPIS